MRAIDADAFDERVRAAGGMSEEELTEDFKDGVQAVLYMLSNQPTIQPEIIHCKDCRKHNKKLGFDENYNITYRDDACPLIPWRGMSKGHEHDYQSCCLGEKREVTTLPSENF